MRVASYCEELPASLACGPFLHPHSSSFQHLLSSCLSLTLAFLHLPPSQKDTSDATTTMSCRPFPISGPLTQKVARSQLLGPDVDVPLLPIWCSACLDTYRNSYK